MFDKSSPYIKFGRNWVINDISSSVHKCKLIGGGHFAYRTNREFVKSNPCMRFGGNWVIND